MPRISPVLAKKALSIQPYLPLLLPECRTLESAKQELKWIRYELSSSNRTHYRMSVKKACLLRYQHVPLQYILGTQPFGSLNIICKRNVLIPRWETEEWATALLKCLIKYWKNHQLRKPLSIWDLCSGSGCISLLSKSELNKADIKSNITAIDLSSAAISLIKLNMQKLKIQAINVKQLNILDCGPTNNSFQEIDVLICNPPYIPKHDFNISVNKSVRLYEPKLALIGDLEFYENLIDSWLLKGNNRTVNSFVYEIGDIHQFNYIKERINKNPLLKDTWEVGLKFDSNGKPRCVFGFNKIKPAFKYIFHEFGSSSGIQL
ncbi:S-adenosylmethionine-dependent methyltransferase NDAI_0D01310 [Naumovozyma dairenensis CBS 421]|uniref:peptide chain release factor N(5)-glutamine methyltransferase n=1 Tax=Naumovozyma dairenensis (strain ATCC 10597 / BCRC 20456 / CBS 421 / NBRC 0211 / NRRL Y-12639) TaxID=1071378 RepID=G0W9I4_NAUDC|nr:hypothetical protein NDAI_0D01310 [Naumovozyma dairenensis CBS 421]CCD24445.1 hypothetical protein NDAI_0D01310 [Naumovozyma dairenensis CBS 421]